MLNFSLEKRPNVVYNSTPVVNITIKNPYGAIVSKIYLYESPKAVFVINQVSEVETDFAEISGCTSLVYSEEVSH